MIAIRRSPLQNYTLSSGSFSAENLMPELGAASVRDLGWDALLDEVFSEAASALGGGLGDELVKRLTGGAPWEREVSAKLDTVIARLQDIVVAIRALEKLFRVEIVRGLQERLDADLRGGVRLIAALITRIRIEGLTDALRDQLTLEVTNLQHMVLSTLEYKEHGNEGRPLGLPLYAGVQSCVLMIVIGQRILGTGMGDEIVKEMIRRFGQWADFVEEQLADMRQPAEAEAVFLNSIPKRAPMTSCNLPQSTAGGGPCFFRHLEPTDPWLLYGVIEGDVNTPFRIVAMEEGPKYNRFDSAPYFKEAVHGVPQFPLWARYASPPAHYAGAVPNVEPVGARAIFLLQQTCEALEARRIALLSTLDSIRDLQAIRDSLLLADGRMKVVNAWH